MAALMTPGAETAPLRLNILGATGSVGQSTLDLVRQRPGDFRVGSLTAHRNAAGLARAARETGAQLAVIADPACHAELKEALAGSGIKAAAGQQALIEAASQPADLVMAAIVGIAGLAPTLAAARSGARIALANKECLVCAGRLLIREIEQAGGCLIPVDSEHNALFQMIPPDRLAEVERITLTASGGPFLRHSREAMASATPKEAQNHPIWRMGAKISIDSATLMNKGFELIEAHCLFPIPPEGLDIVIHPQSLVHAIVAWRGGGLLAHMGAPDMRAPIAHALAFPSPPRRAAPELRPDALGALTFEPVDESRFPAPRLARTALQYGGLAPTLLNAANEMAVEAFIAGRIGFLDIVPAAEQTLACAIPSCADIQSPSIGEIMQADAQARACAEPILQTLAG